MAASSAVAITLSGAWEETMLSGTLDGISLSDIRRLVDESAEEGRTLEFKRDLLLHDRDSKREFLSDVTALANTQGGHIVFGIAERDGLAAELTGLAVADRDAETLKIENLLRDCVEPRAPGIHLKWISLDDDR